MQLCLTLSRVPQFSLICKLGFCVSIPKSPFNHVKVFFNFNDNSLHSSSIVDQQGNHRSPPPPLWFHLVLNRVHVFFWIWFQFCFVMLGSVIFSYKNYFDGDLFMFLCCCCCSSRVFLQWLLLISRSFFRWVNVIFFHVFNVLLRCFVSFGSVKFFMFVL